MMYLRKTFIGLMVTSSMLFSEPSVYGNANFSTGSQNTEYNQKKLLMLEQKISMQNERIDGLMSIVEGLSASVNELQHSSEPETVNNGQEKSSLLQDLGEMIDKINTTYVSKDALKKRLGNSQEENVPVKKREVASKDETNKKEDNKKLLESQSSAVLYSEGVRLFVKQAFDEAKKRFLLTDEKAYKTAASNYYLGEISYYTKKYEDAIFYFKKSAGLNDKVSYIDTLLLHTAISLDKTGQKEQARIFYENIITNYAGKKTASIARDRVGKL
ncbi:MAG: TPR repeat containing exported protein; Putative periplasmic protein contains a protein prenylyltransferase domain [uncultured Sulfurovum sp.]|uniref:TPR repeat containing exported protein Putative periplasmic protein contains a protein prenylyltransferase domain n=1 Tax=uncultured Sulfurovum sp. TaxID=269237 RepID=A0A6S6S0F8_9BACT|nr:MAG: TPR repeat containing exported protein; Putative periplasmic protein contains a protein prenylyltransferase domain [uncultured Sulfurovum sp.]